MLEDLTVPKNDDRLFPKHVPDHLLVTLPTLEPLCCTPEEAGAEVMSKSGQESTTAESEVIPSDFVRTYPLPE